LRREVESLLESPANAPRLDSVNGHPMGEPFLVHHFHAASRRWGSTGFGNATATRMFLAELHEASSNICMTTIGSN
jgi:hypothetical protein